jgi:orotidine-5'-phosphate decarboxylase
VSERGRIIEADRSIVVGADVHGDDFPGLVDQTGDIEGVSSYKLGFQVGYSRLSLPAAVDYVHQNTDKKVIFDHQKAGNDIDKTGENFAKVMDDAAVDAAILFPFTGPEVEDRWIKELQEREIDVIVGSEMTHSGFLYSEGGRIADNRLLDIFDQAIDLGVRDFVVPGNKPGKVEEYRNYFQKELGLGQFALYAPGFIAQGGRISETGKVAGKSFHAIVASGIVKDDDPRAAAQGMVGAL